jgi:hypothetical protein
MAWIGSELPPSIIGGTLSTDDAHPVLIRILRIRTGWEV